jgi:hypothetical protein
MRFRYEPASFLACIWPTKHAISFATPKIPAASTNYGELKSQSFANRNIVHDECTGIAPAPAVANVRMVQSLCKAL